MASSASLPEASHCLAVQRLPKPKPTGDPMRDQEALATHSVFLEMVSGCLDDRSHIMPLFSRYQERARQAMKNTSIVVSQHDKFPRISTLAQLYKDHADFFVVAVERHSDMTVSEVSTAIKTFVDSGLQMLVFASQLPEDVKLPSDMVIKQIANAVLDLRLDQVGDRLARFKARGGLMPNGQLDWSKGSYALEAAEGKIIRVTHCSGDWVDCSAFNLSTDYVLACNWSDFRASLERKPLPSVVLHKLFAKDQGPNKLPRITNKSAVLKELCGRAQVEFEAARVGTSKERQTAQLAREQVAKVMHDKRSAQMSVARDKAKLNNAAKKQRTLVQIKSEASRLG